MSKSIWEFRPTLWPAKKISSIGISLSCKFINASLPFYKNKFKYFIYRLHEERNICLKLPFQNASYISFIIYTVVELPFYNRFKSNSTCKLIWTLEAKTNVPIMYQLCTNYVPIMYQLCINYCKNVSIIVLYLQYRGRETVWDKWHLSWNIKSLHLAL